MELDAKIYVAGHRGMVGSAIERALRARGHEKIVTRSRSELDLTRQDQAEEFFAAERPDHVFLAAAKVGGILANNTYKAEFIHENLAIATNVIDAAHRHGVKKLLNLGSSCIYPRFAPQPIREEHLLTGELEPTNEPYAIAKIAAIKLCRYYNEQYGTGFISLMPTNLYGPNDNYNLETAHVFPAMIRKFVLARALREGDVELLTADVAARRLGSGLDGQVDLADPASIARALETIGVTGEAVRLWGTGNPRREFLFVEDLADASIFAMNELAPDQIGELVNVGVGEDVTIRELAETIAAAVGYEGEIRFDINTLDGMARKLLDVSKFSGLGWRASTTLHDGIVRTVEWYRRSLDRAPAQRAEAS